MLIMMDLINWAKDGQYRIKTLDELSKNSLLSSELAEKLQINRASMSRILKALKEKLLVSDITSSSRTVTYSITKKGKEILGKIKK
tara:strand:- start:2435 stop:2692 length:258 start_codon:yes stop_codon:yes gene_type:complete